MATTTGSPWSLPYPESDDDVRPHEDIQALAAQAAAMLSSIVDATWTAYVPVLSSSGGTQPVLGNGTIAGEYRREVSGNIIDVTWNLTIGSTTTLGSGALFVSAPVNAHANAITQNLGAAWVLDSGVVDKSGILKWETAAKWAIVIGTNGVVTPSSNIPQTFATGDRIGGTCRYRPA